MSKLSDEDERFLIYRTAHWIDQGFDIPDAQARAESELPFKDSIAIPKKPSAPSTRLSPRKKQMGNR
ncbi:MAG: hypothetical protein ACLPKB_04075 [Xanthobacteraceae bacterium]